MPPIRKCIIVMGKKILNLDFTIFCCGTFYFIILIVPILCSVNHLKSEKVYRGYILLAKFFKMAARSSTKSELRINSADFEVGENDQIISEKQRPLVLRALKELKKFS